MRNTFKLHFEKKQPKKRVRLFADFFRPSSFFMVFHQLKKVYEFGRVKEVLGQGIK
jgi:hypothetical protein